MKFGNIKTKNLRIPVLSRLAWPKRHLAPLLKITKWFGKVYFLSFLVLAVSTKKKLF